MDWEGIFSLLLTLGVLSSLIFTKVRPHVAMMAALTLLSALQILSPSEALAGFSNEGLITVAAMFVVAGGIHASGGVDIVVDKLLGKPKSLRTATLRVTLPVMLMSGFLNNTPVVATMIPAIHSWSKKIGVSASKLMIPLSYASIVGGTMTLIGTSTNLVVNGLYQSSTGNEGFSLFSISAIGISVALAGCVFMYVFFPKWLPNRNRDEAFDNLREFTLEVAVDPNGPLVGKTILNAGLRNLGRLYLVEIERDQTILSAVSSEEQLAGNDRLVFAGDTEAISDLLRINGIIPSDDSDSTSTLSEARPERCLVEAVVSPHCSAIGSAIREARFRDRYGAVVLAVARNGERVKGNLGSIQLKAGDSLLLEARPAFVSRQKFNKDFLLVNDLEKETPRHDRAYLAWAILFIVVAAAGFGVMSMLNAALIGAGLMMATGCLSVAQAERSLDYTVLITIAASFSLGAALSKTGVSDFLAHHIIELSQNQPWLMLVLVYIAVNLLTELVTNNAAAIIMLPITLDVTSTAGLNPEPFIFAIMFAASASFMTPIGYQTNLMVYGPGNYKFTDFLRVGAPMSLLIGTVTLSMLLLFWDLNIG